MDQPKRRVLIVDDEPSVVKLVTKCMELAGFEVVVAMDGQAALTKVREHNPDVVILDVMLPKLNGFEVCSLLKQNSHYQHIPIIMFTALMEEQDYWKGMACGADAYLSKPFSIDALEQLVKRLIEALRPNLSSEHKGSAAQRVEHLPPSDPNRQVS